MKSTCLGLLIVVAMTTSTQAGIMQFLPGTPAENPFNVIGDGMFELSSVPNSAPNDFQFPVITSFDVEVIAEADPDGTMPVVFSLVRGSTRDGHANLVFENPLYDELFVQFDVPELSQGDPFPMTLTDADGVVEWNAKSLSSPSTAPVLAGVLTGARIVPEPASFSGLMLGLVACVFGFRRRKN